MWVLKFSMSDNKGVFSWRCQKFKVKIYAQKTGYYIKENKVYLNGIILVQGNDKNKNDYIKSLRQDKFIKKLEVNGNLINCLLVKPLCLASKRKEGIFYSLELVYLKPIFTNEEGIEVWELGCWNKKLLGKILEIVKKLYNGKLIFLKKLKIAESDFLFFSLYPKLTNKQKQAFLLALEEGYYEFPREIELKRLAKIMKLSYTTYQFHLRKAERKIMNSVGSKI